MIKHLTANVKMNINKYSLCFLLFFISLIFAIFAQDSSDSIVQTKNGQVKGHQFVVLNKTVNEFIGIRYAQPPVRDLRFKIPVPVENWSGVYDATKQGNICWQKNDAEYNVKDMNEDCLFLNIWSTNLTDQMPVIFYIHGGAFIKGSSYRDSTNGSALATFGVVIVTFNYRLGPFGFLYGRSKEAPGNVGLYDQLLALIWVNQNIKSFGGDPNEITIFGESSGAFSVGYHLLSDLSEGLFKRAILNSGSSYFIKNFNPSNEIYLNKAKEFSRSLGCGHVDNYWLKCMKLLKPNLLIDNKLVNGFSHQVIDGVIYKRTAQETFSSLDLNLNVTILTGVMSDEGSVYAINEFPKLFKDSNSRVTKADLKEAVRKAVVFDVDKIYDTYIGFENEINQIALKKSFANILGDRRIVCPTNFFAKEFSKLNNSLNAKVYFYRFSHKLKNRSYSSCKGDWVGNCHYEDVPIVFGQAVIDPSSFTEIDYQFSLLIMTLWTNFAKNG